MLTRKYERLAGVAVLIFVISFTAQSQGNSIYRLPAGTRMTLKLDDELSSRYSGAGDTFIAKVARPVFIRDVMVVPAGTAVQGSVASATSAGIGGRSGDMRLSFVTLFYGSEMSRAIDGSLTTQLRAERKGSAFRYLSVLGGAGIGALLGGVTGSSRNVLIGSAAGAGLGVAIAASRKGSDVRIGKNVEFEIELKKEVVLPVLDY